MNKKKLCAGALALALSLGAITPGVSTSYATDTVVDSEGNADQEAENITNDDTTENNEFTRLQNLIDEVENLKKSQRFLNASKSEQTAYINAIEEAKKADENTETSELTSLADSISTAKKNLGAILRESADNRDGLNYNILLAENLIGKDISDDNKTKLEDSIKEAKSDLNDLDLLDSAIVESSQELLKTVQDISKAEGIDFKDIALDDSQVKSIKASDNVDYNRSIDKLGKLINEVNDLSKTEEFTKIKNTDLINELSSNSYKAEEVYNNTNSSVEDINTAYTELLDSFNNVKNEISGEDTPESDIKDELNKLVNKGDQSFKKNPEYENASEFSLAIYEEALKKAKSILEDDDASEEDIESAQIGLKLARQAAVPVPVKTLDNNSPSDDSADVDTINLDELNNLIDEYQTIIEGDDYNNADKDAQAMYDKSISAAKLITEKSNPSQDEINEAVKTIRNAKSGLKAKGNQNINENLTKAREDLYALVSKGASVQQSNSYKNATNAQKKAYVEANNSASQLLTDYANKEKTPKLEDINEAKKAITDALAAMNYVEPAEYPTNIDDILVEAESFKASPNYLAKKDGSKEEKDLVATYDELIKQAKNYKNTANPKAEVLSLYVDRINEIKKTINNEMSYDELKLRTYVRQAEKAINSDDFGEVLQERRERLKEAHKGAKELLESDDLTEEKIDSAVSDLEAALRPADIQKILNSDKDDIPEDKLNNYDVETMSLEELLSLAIKVKEHPNYQFASPVKISNLNYAIERARDYSYDESRSTKEKVVSDLTKALTAEDINAIVERIRDTEGTNLSEPDYVRELKELVNYAQKIIDAEGYYDIPRYKRDLLTNNYNSGIGNIKIGTKAAIIENIKALRETLSDQDFKPYLDKLGLKLSDIKPYEENKNSDAKDESKEEDINNLGLDKLIDLANKVKNHSDYEEVGETQKNNFEQALDAAKTAETDDEKENAQKALLSALNQSEIKPIVVKIRANEAKVEDSKDLADLKELITFAGKVIDHPDYTNVDKNLRDELAKALIDAKKVVENKDEAEIIASKSALNKLLEDDRLADIVKSIKENARELSPRELIEKIISEDEDFRKTDKFKKAKKELKDDYTKALTIASEVIKDENASDEDLKTAADAIKAAKNALDGDQFESRLKALKEKFDKEKGKITDSKKKEEIENLIAALDSEDATMDDIVAVEEELIKALPKGTVKVTTTPTTTTTTTTTPAPTTTTTTTPVTTTSTVPSTVTPGSIVRTGIKSLIGVAILLAVAVGAFVLTGKNKDNKNKNKRTFESDDSKKGEK